MLVHFAAWWHEFTFFEQFFRETDVLIFLAETLLTTYTTCTPTTPTPELNRRDEKESEAESMTSNRTPDGDKF